MAASFKVGGRIYVCSDRGVVMALDSPPGHFEIGMTAVSSKDWIGLDADCVEFPFSWRQARCALPTRDGTFDMNDRAAGIWGYGDVVP